MADKSRFASETLVGVEYKSIALTADTSKTGGSWSNVLTLSLEKGVWVVTATVSFIDASLAGEKWVRLSVEGSDPYYRSGGGLSPTSFCNSYTQIVNKTTTGNAILRTYSSANYTLGKTHTMLRAVRIGDLKETT